MLQPDGKTALPPTTREPAILTYTQAAHGKPLIRRRHKTIPKQNNKFCPIPVMAATVSPMAEGYACTSCGIYFTADVFSCTVDETHSRCIWCSGGRGHRCTGCERLYIGDSVDAFGYRTDGKRAEYCILCKLKSTDTEVSSHQISVL